MKRKKKNEKKYYRSQSGICATNYQTWCSNESIKNRINFIISPPECFIIDYYYYYRYCIGTLMSDFFLFFINIIKIFLHSRIHRNDVSNAENSHSQTSIGCKYFTQKINYFLVFIIFKCAK